jgi:hypothetical protein
MSGFAGAPVHNGPQAVDVAALDGVASVAKPQGPRAVTCGHSQVRLPSCPRGPGWEGH